MYTLTQLLELLEEGLVILDESTGKFASAYELACRLADDTDHWPPSIAQCAPPHRDKPLNSQTRLTFCKAGCLVCSLYSLAVWAGYGDTLLHFAEELDREEAFEGAYLQHPSRAWAVYTSLYWTRETVEPHGCSSLVHWRDRPADLDLLQGLLTRHPVIAEVDYKPKTEEVDQHFVLALQYIPASKDGQVEDDLLVMDSIRGSTCSVLAYFNPDWLRDGTMAPGVTMVQRVLTGLRIWWVR